MTGPLHNGADWMMTALEAEGIDTLFGYPGGAIMPFYDALHRFNAAAPRVRHILARHEQGAAFAANGYARATGRLGVCVATSGPGASNLVTALADALTDSVPMLCLTGQVPSALIGTDAFQELDVFAMTRAVTKHSFRLRRVEDLPTIFAEAVALARSGRPGPVLIDWPKDLQLADAAALRTHRPVTPAPPAPADEAAIAAALTAIRQAQRPLLYVGGGVVLGEAVEPLRALADHCGLPAVLTLKALGALAPDDPLNLGMLGMHGNRIANMAVQACDLLIAVGARFDDRVTGRLDGFAPGARVVHLDADAAEVGKLRHADIAVVGGLADAVRRLHQGLARHDLAMAPRWWALGDGAAAVPPVPGHAAPNAPMLLERLSRLAPAAIVTTDVGQHQMWVAQYWRVSHPRRHLTSGSLGAMGFGLPAAIGAQLALPDAPVICVSGDGSIMMNIQELATVRRYDLPIKLVLLDNQALGMVRQWQDLFFAGRCSEIDLSDNPDFVQLAAGFGIAARSITRDDEVADALRALIDAPGPMLLHVAIPRHVGVWPIVPPNHCNDEMMTDPAAREDDHAPLSA